MCSVEMVCSALVFAYAISIILLLSLALSIRQNVQWCINEFIKLHLIYMLLAAVLPCHFAITFVFSFHTCLSTFPVTARLYIYTQPMCHIHQLMFRRKTGHFSIEKLFRKLSSPLINEHEL